MGQTVIDAFVVTLGLDNANFKRGQKETDADLKRVREGSKTTADALESDGKRAANFFGSLRTEVVGLFLAFAGAKGLKDFVGQMITGDAATGRFAKNIGMMPERVAGWVGAVKSVGGEASDAHAALLTMADSYQNLIHLGQSGHGAELAGLGIRESDLKKGPDAMLRELAEAAQHFSPNEFRWRAKGMISDSMITLLEKGGTETGKLVDHYQGLAKNLAASAEAAQKLEAALTDLQTIITSAVTPEVTAFVSTLTGFVDGVTKGTTKLPGFNDALVTIGVTAGIIGSPFVVLAAAIALVATNIDSLKASWKSYADWYEGLSASSDSVFDPVRKALGMKTGAEANAAGTDAFGNPIGGLSTGGGSAVRTAKVTAPAATGGSNADQIRSFFRAHGFSAAQTEGILGSIHAENTRMSASADNPTSHAYGLGQWLSKDRVANFHRVMGKPLRGSSLQDQMAFMLWEMNNTESGAGAAVRGAGTAPGASAAMINKFYRPGPGTPGDMQRAGDYIRGARTGASPRAPGGNSSSSQSVNVNGPITIYVPSGDPKTIARGLKGALDQRMIAVQANTGVGG